MDGCSAYSEDALKQRCVKNYVDGLGWPVLASKMGLYSRCLSWLRPVKALNNTSRHVSLRFMFVCLEESMSIDVSVEKKESHLEKKSQKGASLVEYALLVALVAVAGIAAMKALGTAVSTQFSTVASQVG